MTRTWLFGEAEFESEESFEKNFRRLWNCGEACGYMVHTKKYDNDTKAIILQGSDLECVQIHYDKFDSVIAITKQQWTDRTGEMELIEVTSIGIN